MTNEYKVGAVTVIYNPDNLQNVINSISTYYDEIDMLVVIDNSLVSNKSILEDKFNAKLKYFWCQENIGIGRALNLGINHLIGLGYKWALTMDQDTYFKTKLSGYFSFIREKNSSRVNLLAPCIEGFLLTKTSKEIKKTIQSGCLINLQIYKILGGFEEKYFIDFIDYDYCLKGRKQNFKNVLICNVLIKQNYGECYNGKTFYGLKYKYIFSKPFRSYYQTRNGLDYSIKYRDIKEFIGIVVVFVKTILIANQKIDRIKYMVRGLSDFLSHNWGKLN